jgi:8-oxo-dGTP pyrophosphatase MutT (NUDIX family)
MKTITCRSNYGKIVELPIEKFKPRPSVYAVFKKEDRILVCRTKSNGKLWLPGGGVETGETHEEALRREVAEETGITDMKFGRLISDFRNYCYYEPLDEACDAHLFFYECETEEEKVKSNEEIEDGEAMDFSWMKMEQILKEGFCDADEKIREMLISLYDE